MNVSTIPASKGPGRYKATTDIISSKEEGLIFTKYSFRPLDSSWNTAVVKPF